MEHESEPDLIFAPEDEVANHLHFGTAQPWTVLIVDDEPAVHDVTRLALANFEFDGKPLAFLHAHSGKEAVGLLNTHHDIALAMVDVVMETEHAGLDLVRWIRKSYHNTLIRIVLRTGQPGQAPERSVIRDYDINDYKEKTELSSQKLFSTVFTSLRSYRDLQALDANRRGLERVIRASGEVFRNSMLKNFIQGVLEQLVALLYLDADSMYVNCDSLALERSEDGEKSRSENELKILAATGQFEPLIGKNARNVLPADVFSLVLEALSQRESIARGGTYVGYFRVSEGREDILYITSSHSFSSDNLSLLRMFCQNVSIAYDNAILRDEVEGTQRDMVYMLGEAIETRSHETGQHVRRVAEYCYLIALGLGMSLREAEILRVAAPLHDFGKIGIHDDVLNRPGSLSDVDWVEMKKHVSIGFDLLKKSRREILRVAAIIAGQHHEKWDGSGYPEGRKGVGIHIYGRIGAVADVFDALGSRRCYKEPWPDHQIFEFLVTERGRHFDPDVVDWVLAHREEMLAVREHFPD